MQVNEEEILERESPTSNEIESPTYSDLLKMPTKTKSDNLANAVWTEGLQVGECKSLSPDVKRVG